MTPPRLTRDRAIAAAIVLLTLAAYLPALRNGWIWDDDYYVTNNPTLQNPAGLWHIWTRIGLPNGGTPQYYPLVHTTFWLEHHLYANHPLAYHLDNLLLHAASAILLWQLLKTLNVPAAPWAALLWAVHPVNVESVAWVTERKNVLAGVFYFAALLTYFRHRLDAPTPRAPQGWRAYAAVLVLFTAALLSKTVTATLPAAVLVILWWKHGRLTRRDIIPMLPLIALGAALGSLTGYIERHYVGAHGPDFDLSPLQRLLLAGRAPWFYLAKILCPARLSFIYDKWTLDPRAAWQWLYPTATAALTVVLFAFRNRIGRGWLAAWLLFIGTLFPALGFVSVYPFRYSYVADHFQYLASAPAIAAIAAALAIVATALRRLPSPFILLPSSFCLLLPVLLAVLTWTRTKIFHDAQTLWTATIKTNPHAWMARNNLAGLLINHGDYAAAQSQMDQVANNWPDAPEVHINLGKLAEARNDDPAAQREYQLAARLGNGDTTAVYNLARVTEKLGDPATAERLYRQVLAADPRDPNVRANLGALLARSGHPDEAESLYRQDIALHPRAVPSRVNWAQLDLARGDARAAESLLREALNIDPASPTALNTRGALEGSQGRLDAAERDFRAALRADPELAQAHNNLGSILRRRGNTEAAAHEYRAALALDPNLQTARQNLAALQPATRPVK